MLGIADELRLAMAVALTALLSVTSWRFARRCIGADWVQTTLDALLLTFLAQYVAVGVPGLLGVLNVWSIAATAIVLAAILFAVAPQPFRDPLKTQNRTDHWVVGAALLLVICYLAALIFTQRRLPPIANDSLTYHLPAAVQWLQSRSLGLYETWLYNPANTYSPLAGSMFITWLMAPAGNDVLARFVQAPALIMLFLAIVQVARSLGAAALVAALIATGAVLSRPFISQATLAKDDLFVAAFFASAVAGMSPARLTDRLGAWRIGIAIGLLLATKYTVLLSVPLLLVMIDAPSRAWKSRHWLIASLGTLLVAGPWYVRNLVLTGNPLYPIELEGFEGLFSTRRSEVLGSMAGLRQTFVGGYFSTTLPVAALLVVAWLSAIILSFREFARNPLTRLCLIGPALGIALFIATSPYAEIRFVYPSLLLLFASAAIVASRLRGSASIAVGAVVAIAGVATGFVPLLLVQLLPATIGITLATILLAWLVIDVWKPQFRRIAPIAAVFTLAIVGCLTYVYWPGYLRGPSGYAALVIPGWRQTGYEGLSDAWEFVREELPGDATIAYANTYFTYPLYGFDLSRRVIYAPVRPHIQYLHDLPPIGLRLSGEQIVPHVAAALSQSADYDLWQRNLKHAGAQYLFVARLKAGVVYDPPEAAFAKLRPQQFDLIFNNESVSIYRIHTSSFE